MNHMEFWWGDFILTDSISKKAECQLYTKPCAKVMMIEYDHSSCFFTLHCLGQRHAMKVIPEEMPLTDYTWAMAKQDLEKVKVYALTWLKLVINLLEVSLRDIKIVPTKTGG